MSWILDPALLPALARGATLLGTGGGGDPYIGRLMVEAAIAEHGPVTVLDVDELDPDALVISTAMMGAPTVMVEKIPRGDEAVGPCARWRATSAAPPTPPSRWSAEGSTR